MSSLIDPKLNHEPVITKDYESSFLYEALRKMLLIRKSEEKLAEQRKDNVIGGPVHLSAGQEAIAVGVSMNLTNQDRVFGAHRSHSHVLALSDCVEGLFAEVLGKETGLSKGMGGSMHLINMESGFYGSVPIVAGTVPLAVGAALDAKRNKEDAIGVSYLGDGAIEEGVVSESLNLAAILKIPCLFVMENNLFSSHMHISLRQLEVTTTRIAEMHGVENTLVDGNNFLEVYEASKTSIKGIKETNKPFFLEAITYRHFGHVDWRKDVDVGVNRSQEDISDWEMRDPIRKLYLGMLNDHKITKKDFEELGKEITYLVEESWKNALNDPYPESSQLLQRVYKNE